MMTARDMNGIDIGRILSFPIHWNTGNIPVIDIPASGQASIVRYGAKCQAGEVSQSNRSPNVSHTARVIVMPISENAAS